MRSGRNGLLHDAVALLEQLLFPRQRMRRDGFRSAYCGVQSSVLAMRLVSAIMVMMSPGRRGAVCTAKLRPETRRTASMVSSTE